MAFLGIVAGEPCNIAEIPIWGQIFLSRFVVAGGILRGFCCSLRVLALYWEV